MPTDHVYPATFTEPTTENAPQPLSNTSFHNWLDQVGLLEPDAQVVIKKLKTKRATMYGTHEVNTDCPACGTKTRTLHIYGWCDNCARCVSCAKEPWTNPETRLCESCICTRCRYATATPNIPGQLCERCRNTKLCTNCNRGYNAEIHVRTFLKEHIRVCSNCATPNPKNKFRCFYCDGRGLTYNEINSSILKAGRVRFETKRVLICRQCANRPSCWTDKCLPVRQCESCKARQIQQDQNALNDHPEGQQGALFKVNKPIFHTATPLALRKTNRSPRLAGGELEFSGLKDLTPKTIKKLHALVDKWGASILYDGSLPKGGGEIAWAPAAGDLLLQQIDEITTTLHELGAWTNAQCGYHVHVDGRDHTPADIRKLLRLYAALEPALIRTQPFQRIMVMDPVNHKFYCKPCGPDYVKNLDDMTAESAGRIYSAVTKQKLITNVFGPDVWRPTKDDHYASAKYKAFNVYSWFYHDRKTFEFRLHSGTTVPRKIKDWALTCIAIIDTAYKMTDRAVPRPATVDDSIGLLLHIAPTERSKAYLKSRIDRFRKEYDEAPEPKKLPTQKELLNIIYNGTAEQANAANQQLLTGLYTNEELPDTDDENEEETF